MRHAVALALALAIAGCLHAKAADTTPVAPSTPTEVVAAGKGAIEQWRQAYEVKSFDALAKLYVHSPDTVVVVDGLPLIGWSSIEPMLRDKLARAKEIHIRLKEVSVMSLAPTVAGAIATMTREVSDGVTTVTENGALTLVFEKTHDGWQIVSEHYSYKRPS
jgi:ketosteroid isomerase-like protein